MKCSLMVSFSTSAGVGWAVAVDARTESKVGRSFGSHVGSRGGRGHAVASGPFGTALAQGGEGGWVRGASADRGGIGGKALAESDAILGSGNGVAIAGTGGSAAPPLVISVVPLVVLVTRADGGRGGRAEAKNAPANAASASGAFGGIGRGAGHRGGRGGDACLIGAGTPTPGIGGEGQAAGLDADADVAENGVDGEVVQCED